ncbi:hypothetical protein LOH54_09815 [Sulfurimonas sp. HSL-3221]|nr:hypothetical protein [Sulfurimonas sp. HSL-3221]UFS61946.1 hypothetical protein LOH54_09815 [Sulfurimonas sp. HSL-3221]
MAAGREAVEDPRDRRRMRRKTPSSPYCSIVRAGPADEGVSSTRSSKMT